MAQARRGEEAVKMTQMAESMCGQRREKHEDLQSNFSGLNNSGEE
jgi:hypothetical protein